MLSRAPERHSRQGSFQCAGCGLPVFSSAQKFDSGTGWPSFWAPIKKENVIEETDKSAGDDAHQGRLRTVRRPSGPCVR